MRTDSPTRTLPVLLMGKNLYDFKESRRINLFGNLVKILRRLEWQMTGV